MKGISCMILIFFIGASCNSTVSETSWNKSLNQSKLVDQKPLFHQFSYSTDSTDSITFYKENRVTSKVKLKLPNEKLSIDSLLIMNDGNSNKQLFYLSEKNDFFFQISTDFGREHLLTLNTNGKATIIEDQGETYFFDICIFPKKNILATMVTGYGQNPGPKYISLRNLESPTNISKQMNYKQSYNRIEVWRKVENQN